MKEAGVVQVQIGVEALQSDLLRKMNKKRRPIENLQCMKFCEELGIIANSHLMVGFPTETQKDLDLSVGTMEYALSYRPPTRFAYFEVHEGSPVDLTPGNYNISSKDHSFPCCDVIKETLRSLMFVVRDFEKAGVKPTYEVLRKGLKDWHESYHGALASVCPSLFYRSCNDFLQIEDRRREFKVTIIDGWERDLFLFCESIRSMQEIKQEFSSIAGVKIKEALQYLVKLKLMFHEDDCYLSLPIRDKPETRNKMPFSLF
jgi:radical SAM superfamily enzyme YgiQ (UPF0313 family)